MNVGRRTLVIVGAALASLQPVLSVAQQPWQPARPIHVLVSFPTGGHLDFIVRAIAPQLSEALGQPVVVDNRPGANGNVAGALAAKAAPDGLTLLATSADTVAVNPHLYRADFDAVKDLVPIAQLIGLPLMIVARADFPASDAKTLIAHLKSNPKTLGYATPGIGSSLHLVGEVFQREVGVKLNHVPYKGLAPAIADLLGGHVDLVFDAGVGLPQVREGRIKLLTVAARERLPEFPNVGTLREAGLAGFERDASFLLMAPAGTPAPIIERINAEVVRAMRADTIQAQLRARNLRSIANSVPDARRALQDEIEGQARVIREVGIRVE